MAQMHATPLDYWKLSTEIALLGAEAQAVIAMRLMGMAGVWSVTDHENTRMVTEKTRALTQSAQAAGLAAMSGQRPDQILTAAVKPLRRTTSANTRRLARRGPSIC